MGYMNGMFGSILLLTIATLTALAQEPDVFAAIRNNNLDQLRQLIGKIGADVRGRQQTTPLIYAAAMGSLESVKVLVEAGAGVNSQNALGETPLLLAADDIEKTRFLLAKGAKAAALSKLGRSPLIVAASTHGDPGILRMLLEAGADYKAKDAFGVHVLIPLAQRGNVEGLRLVLDRGAETDTLDGGGSTALHNAVAAQNLNAVRLLLARGAEANRANTFAGKVRHGEIALVKLTPLMLASPFGPPDIVRALLDAGARVNDQDSRGMTALMFAVASETQDPRVVKMLLAAGADTKIKSTVGETALDWALKFNNPAVLAELKKAGAPVGRPPVAPPAPGKPLPLDQAVTRSVALLEKTGAEFFRQSGCAGCHHQNVIAFAVSAARAAGISVNEPAAAQSAKASAAVMSPFAPMMLEKMDLPGGIDQAMSTAAGLAASGAKADDTIDSMVAYLASRQHAHGGWIGFFGISRAPMEELDIARTAWAVRVLKTYAWTARKAEFDQRIARARTWLIAAKPRTSYEQAERLLGLAWSAAPAAEVRNSAKALLAVQRPDGGWAQNPNLSSDAYATGLALFALKETASANPKDAAYGRGVQYLLRTQLGDGSWFVRSRAPKFQPYFESGFPHGHDQWISSTATAYATVALAAAVERKAVSGAE